MVLYLIGILLDLSFMAEHVAIFPLTMKSEISTSLKSLPKTQQSFDLVSFTDIVSPFPSLPFPGTMSRTPPHTHVQRKVYSRSMRRTTASRNQQHGLARGLES